MNGSSFESPTIGIGRLLREGNRYMVPHLGVFRRIAAVTFFGFFRHIIPGLFGTQLGRIVWRGVLICLVLGAVSGCREVSTSQGDVPQSAREA